MYKTASKPKLQSSHWFFAVALLPFLFMAAGQQQNLENPADQTTDVRSPGTADDDAKVIAHLKKVSDEELKKTLEDILKLPEFRSMPNYEACLCEIVRRGGVQWELFLEEKLKALMASKFNPYEDEEEVFEEDDLEPGVNFNLELLTTLRRIKKQPDPLEVLIKSPQQLTGTPIALPRLEVMIKNVDTDKTDVGFTAGGDYRSGRQARWRIVVQDEQGNVIAARKHLGFYGFVVNGGGLCMPGVLEHGKSWETSLDIGSFIEVPPPGKYKLTVFYHNTRTIAGEPTVDGLILSKSKPVPLTVLPITITHSKADRETVRRLVSKLNGKKRLKIVDGTYGAWAHKFVSPESPEGKLLGMGLKAVPTLIQSLRDEGVTKEKRNWLFAILYSLTSENAPTSEILTSYSYRESGWRIRGGAGESTSVGLSFGRGASAFGWTAEIDIKAQDELVKTWEKWLQQVEVKEQDEPDTATRQDQ